MTAAEQWDWDHHRRRQRAVWLTATPAQRLAWLEEALRFAAEAGALPSRHASAPEEGSPTEG